MAEWRSFLHGTISVRCNSISLIPVIPTSYRSKPLPGNRSFTNWTAEFWNTCIIRIHCQALPALLTVNPEPIPAEALVQYISAVDFSSEHNLLLDFPNADSSCIAFHLIKQIQLLHGKFDIISEQEREVHSMDTTDGHACLIQLNMSNL